MGNDDKKWRLVSYDMRDPVRYRRLYKLVRGYGVALHYSLFRCHLDDREVERMRWELAKVVEQEDRLMVMDLCPRCARRIAERNQTSGWQAEPEPLAFVVVPENQVKDGAA